MREASATRQTSGVRRALNLIVLDALLLSGLIVATAVFADRGAAALVQGLGLEAVTAGLIVVGAAIVASLPFLVGIGRLSRRLGGALAEAALPRRAGTTLDLDASPRRALILTLQLGVALATGVVVVAVTQPFLPSYPRPVLLFLLVVAFAIALWQSANDLQGHVRAGSQAIVEVLAGYARQAGSDGQSRPSLAGVHGMLVGLGEPVAIQLDAGSPSVGKSLAGRCHRARDHSIGEAGRPVGRRAARAR